MKIINALNEILWGEGMLFLILGSGIYFCIRTKFFQFSKIKYIFSSTICSLFKDKSVSKSNDKKAISQFQAVSTALSATMGTGNIVGVATAISMGGAGAIFWMWASSLIGMIIVFCENVLGIYFRYKNSRGEWIGGPMIYIEKGLGCKWLGGIYAFFCVLASFGMGNMAQVNSISDSLKTSFGIFPAVSGIIIAVICSAVIFGGIKRIGSFAEKTIPFLSLLYIISCIIIIVLNFSSVPSVFKNIFCEAFGIKQAVGGLSGVAIRQAMTVGLRRGVFSNEAGLGSTVIVHSTSDIKSPVKQGCWGIFEVFLDTIVCCTLTAVVILSSNIPDIKNLDGAELVIKAFQTGFGKYAGLFVSISLTLFAFATLVGWSVFGLKSFEYIFSERYSKYYKFIYIVFILIGANMSLSFVWGLSDIFNALMVIPNMIAVVILFPVVKSLINSENFTLNHK